MTLPRNNDAIMHTVCMEISRNRLVELMRAVGVRRAHLTGAHRARTSTRVFATMTGRPLSDPIEYFRKALAIELEHGTINPRTNVTGDDPRRTAKIVAAHLLGVEHGERPAEWRPFPAYYDWLIDMERNGRP
jgi:hypothetical protein